MIRWMLLAAAVLDSGPAAGTPWIDATPKDANEAAIRDALAGSAFAGSEAQATALLARAAAFPGTSASGLARLAAALEQLEAGKADAALATLRHPDVAKAGLEDHAAFAWARALDAKKDAGAAAAYLAAADARLEGPLLCEALFRASELARGAGEKAPALAAAQRTLQACPARRERALLELALAQEMNGELAAAALTLDRLEGEFPASAEAASSEATLGRLAHLLPARPAAETNARAIQKAVALFEAGQAKSALPLLTALKARPLEPAQLHEIRTKLGRSLLALKRAGDAEAELAAVAPGSAHGAEAAFYRARAAAARTGRPDAYEEVTASFPGTSWAEEALLALANQFQKDARDEQAVPYYRRLLEAFPDGRYADRSGWRVGWAEYRAGRYAETVKILERTARLKPAGGYAPGSLYWAGRAKLGLGDTPGARALFQEVVSRHKQTYHGQRAAEALQRLPLGPAPEAAPAAASVSRPADSLLTEAQRDRLRRLLLIESFDAAAAELRLLPPTPLVQATIAYVEHRRGLLRPAIVAMKRAFPEWIGEQGERLPEPVWRILFPLQYAEALRRKAAVASLDASLVAALICQESTFDAGAISSAGARGLMQVIPQTGRALARQLKRRYRTNDLFDPAISLDFGTLYLRQLTDRFGGRVERVLAAYNAGPHRVDAWTFGRPDMSDEEFVESIPFTETRHYVMTVLANRHHYRRLYGLGAASEAPPAAGPR